MINSLCLRILIHHLSSARLQYCTISVNSAVTRHVTRYMPAEMKISASRRIDRYISFFRDFSSFFGLF